MAHKYTKKVGILTPWDMVEIILEKESKDRTEPLIEKISAWFKDRSAFFRLLEKGRKYTVFLPFCFFKSSLIHNIISI